MRVGEQGVPTVEHWLELEAAGVRDAAATATTTDGGGGKGGEGGKASAAAVVAQKFAKGSEGEFRLGVDPWLLSAGTARTLTAKLAGSGGRLVKVVR